MIFLKVYLSIGVVLTLAFVVLTYLLNVKEFTTTPPWKQYAVIVMSILAWPIGLAFSIRTLIRRR